MTGTGRLLLNGWVAMGLTTSLLFSGKSERVSRCNLLASLISISLGAGYGLFATETLQPLTKLLTVPANVLMNKKTLASYYPYCSSLSATQLISLHLSLHHPDGTDLDPFFGPYIATLPRNFDFHPLTWLMNARLLQSTDSVARLLRLFPPSVSSALTKLASRFDTDWQAVVCANTHCHLPTDSAQQAHPELQIRFVEKKHYLWSWLIGMRNIKLFVLIFSSEYKVHILPNKV